MYDFEVEKDIPIPPKGHFVWRRHSYRYPWAGMKSGDSFLIPLDGQSPTRVASSVLTACARQTPRIFTTRQMNGGVRVWRLA